MTSTNTSDDNVHDVVQSKFEQVQLNKRVSASAMTAYWHDTVTELGFG